MSPISITVLAISMSVDAFAASLARGASGDRIRVAQALRSGAVFGIIEAITPVIGWGAGVLAAGFVSAVDHWIAFALLGLVGGRMILEASRRKDDAVPAPRSPWGLVAVAIGTSLDAMAVGVSLAFIDANIWIIAAAVGLATFAMATCGTLVGRMVGARFGRIAEGVGGVALIVLGSTILYEHLLH